MTFSVNQTIVKIKKKNWIVVMVMIWWRYQFINAKNLERRARAFERVVQFVP